MFEQDYLRKGKGQDMKDKLVNVIKIIFGIGTVICLLVGGLSFFGYLAAIIIGGDTAASICKFIYKDMYPILVLISTSMIILGVIKLYICGEAKSSFGKSKKEEKAE